MELLILEDSRISKCGAMVEIHGNFGRRSVRISGARVKIEEIEKVIEDVERIDRSHGTISQLFNAGRIVGRIHLLHSAKLALEALEEGKSFADSPRLELICWTAGLRQIDKSLDRVGVREGSNEIAAITIGEKASEVRGAQDELLCELGVEKDERVLEVTAEKVDDLKEAFSISQRELEVSSLEDLVLEKIALLALEQ